MGLIGKMIGKGARKVGGAVAQAAVETAAEGAFFATVSGVKSVVGAISNKIYDARLKQYENRLAKTYADFLPIAATSKFDNCLLQSNDMLGMIFMDQNRVIRYCLKKEDYRHYTLYDIDDHELGRIAIGQLIESKTGFFKKKEIKSQTIRLQRNGTAYGEFILTKSESEKIADGIVWKTENETMEIDSRDVIWSYKDKFYERVRPGLLKGFYYVEYNNNVPTQELNDIFLQYCGVLHARRFYQMIYLSSNTSK